MAKSVLDYKSVHPRKSLESPYFLLPSLLLWAFMSDDLGMCRISTRWLLTDYAEFPPI